MRSERGEFSLTGLLVAMLLMGVVMAATFSVFGTADRVTRSTELRNEAQDRGRTAIDRMTMELRNLASPTPNAPQAIEVATDTDLVFQTVHKLTPASGTSNTANVKRVRYCVDGGRLYRAEQGPWTAAAPPAMPSAAPGGGCPGAWTARVVATNVLNSAARPLFRFNSTVLTEITNVRVGLDLRVDPKRAAAVSDTVLSSGVFLRNQNRVPSAGFTVVVTAQGLLLNASPSQDPDGDVLKYEWFDVTLNKTIGSGLTLLYAGLVRNSAHQIRLTVTDGGDLTSTFTQTATWNPT
jgi:type II secretory pathway component PulJ